MPQDTVAEAARKPISYNEYSMEPSVNVEHVCYGRQYNEVRQKFQYWLNRSYECTEKMYYIVFNPIKSVYQKAPEWFHTKKFIDSVHKYFKYKFPNAIEYCITREIISQMPHINVIFIMPSKVYNIRNGACNNKFAMLLSPPKKTLIKDRDSLLAYIIKEALLRPFNEYIDYIRMIPIEYVY